MSDVVIVDLGMGNLRSVARACERAGARVAIESQPDRIEQAPRVIVPGQGAFRECADRLEGELGEALVQVIRSGTPFLGICLGMQALFESSEEAPGKRGLGVYAGVVRRFPSDRVAEGRRLKVPHMGWNQIEGSHPLFPAGEWFYFVHSYYCDPADSALTVATANYGGPFCAALAQDNVVACQFHPEKSHHAGQRLLRSFLEGSWN